MYECKKCGEKFKSISLKANHVRWNHHDQKEYIEKSKKKRVERIVESVTCYKSECNNVFEVTYTLKTKKDKYFCSRSCANSRGPRSQNFKDKVSKKLTKPIELYGQENVNCFFCDNVLSKKQLKRKNKFCSVKCSSSYRSDVNRQIMDEKKKYRLDCSFKFNLGDFPEEFDFSLIEQYGWYTASNRGGNLNGVSRDHLYSVMSGYENNVDPKLISHPANCGLKRHDKNISKGSSCDITLEELKKRIKLWNKKYK